MGSDAEPTIYTLHDLTERADRILSEISHAGKPAFITSYGRFIAIITPLAPGEIEAPALAEMAREIEAQLSEDENRA